MTTLSARGNDHINAKDQQDHQNPQSLEQILSRPESKLDIDSPILGVQKLQNKEWNNVYIAKSL